jgi:hypothetical protein
MTQYRYSGSDDQELEVSRRDLSGGINTRQAPRQISDNQVENISNYDISIPGEIRKDKGLTLIEDLGDDGGTGCFGFEPSGGTNVLVVTHGTKLETWPATGTFTERKTNFTTGLNTTIVKAEEDGEGDVFLVGNGVDNWYRFEPDDYSTPQDLGSTTGTGSDSPPKSTVGLYYRNRFWVVKNNLAYFSDPYPSSYATAFDTASNAFRMTLGPERAAIGLRDLGIVFIGRDQIWGLNPSVIPDPTTDKPEKILEIGCVAGKTAVQVADDIMFLARDGVRGLFRTQQDKVQTGRSYPISYILKTEYESINWAYIQNSCAIYYDNKYLLALPVNSSTTNNQVWIYYPANNSWRVRDDWNVAGWGTMTVGGEQRLYYIDSTDGKVYRAFYGDNDNGTAITSSITGKEEDLGYPSRYKVGGELEVEAFSTSEAATLTVTASIDGGAYQAIGTLTLTSGTAPTLPISLPFNLADNNVISGKFHLDSLGRWKTIQVKIEDSNDTSDDVIIYSYTIRTFLEEYENE